MPPPNLITLAPPSENLLVSVLTRPVKLLKSFSAIAVTVVATTAVAVAVGC